MIHLQAAGALACTVIAAVGGIYQRGANEPGAHRSLVPPSTLIGARRTSVYGFGVFESHGPLLQLAHRTPSLVTGTTGTVVQIATSNSDSYALTSNGNVWAWGAGHNGELGNGTAVRFARNPVKVSFPAGVRIAFLANPMPYDGGLAVDSEGHVWGWGINVGHELCLPGAQPLLRPTLLPLDNVTLATGAGLHSLFYSKGIVYACGSGKDGELGDGAAIGTAVPTPVVGLPAVGVKTLQSSWRGSGALMDNGSYYDWGFNHSGQLGDGTRIDSSIPVRVPLPDAVTQVSQGGSLWANGQSLAILADGSLWAWGNGRWGQLGNGGSKSSPVPIPVKTPAGLRPVAVDSGGYSSYAIDASGLLWAWGSNKYGQLGTGGSGPVQRTPVSVGFVLSQISSTAANVAGLRS